MLESTVPSRDRPAASNPDSSAMSAAAQPSQQIYILGYPIAGNGPVFRVLHVFALFVSLSFELSRGRTLAKLSENSLGFRMERSEEVRAATVCRRAGGVK